MSSENFESKAMRRLLVLNVIALVGVIASAGACASYRAVTHTVADAAEIVCAGYYAENRKITYDEAMRDFCATEQQLKPWIDVIFAAKRRMVQAKEAPQATTVYIDRSDAGF